METLTSSKSFLMISKNSITIRAFESKFPRSIGEKINYNNIDYYVFSLFETFQSAAGFLGCYGANDAYKIAKNKLGNKISTLNIK